MSGMNTSAVNPATVQGKERQQCEKDKHSKTRDRVAQASGEFPKLLVYTTPLHPRKTKYRDSVSSATATITEEPENAGERKCRRPAESAPNPNNEYPK